MTEKPVTPLAKYRRTMKQRQEDLAALLGVTPSQVSRIEREGTSSLDMALKLSEVTGLPVAAFARKAAA